MWSQKESLQEFSGVKVDIRPQTAARYKQPKCQSNACGIPQNLVNGVIACKVIACLKTPALASVSLCIHRLVVLKITDGPGDDGGLVACAVVLILLAIVEVHGQMVVPNGGKALPSDISEDIHSFVMINMTDRIGKRRNSSNYMCMAKQPVMCRAISQAVL